MITGIKKSPPAAEPEGGSNRIIGFSGELDEEGLPKPIFAKAPVRPDEKPTYADHAVIVVRLNGVPIRRTVVAFRDLPALDPLPEVGVSMEVRSEVGVHD